MPATACLLEVLPVSVGLAELKSSAHDQVNRFRILHKHDLLSACFATTHIVLDNLSKLGLAAGSNPLFELGRLGFDIRLLLVLVNAVSRSSNAVLSRSVLFQCPEALT